MIHENNKPAESCIFHFQLKKAIELTQS